VLVCSNLKEDRMSQFFSLRKRCQLQDQRYLTITNWFRVENVSHLQSSIQRVSIGLFGVCC